MTEYRTDSGLVIVESGKNGHTKQGMTDIAEVESRLRGELDRSESNVELLKESLAELELSLEDTGWSRISGFGDREFSVAGLRKLRRLARMNWLKNPLIRHAVNVQCHYVWGQGVTVSAFEDNVNQTLQKFLNDPKNIKVFSGHQARTNLELALQVEGELFFSMFTNENNGRVVIRCIVPDEIDTIITNPEDYQEPWFYKRLWTKRAFSTESGEQTVSEEFSYHPDWRLIYNNDPEIPNRDDVDEINGYPIMWDAPIYHMKVGSFGDQLHGCPEIYAAIDWARAVKEDLEDYATIRRAHSRFAWKMTAKGGPTAIGAAKQKLGTTMNLGGTGQIETNPPPASGSVWAQAAGAGDLQPMKTAGMLPSPEEGRRLWLMISAGTGIPETILSGNADVGNLATAKTLDRPTELQMENRRQLWTDVLIDVLGYVIDMSIKAPNGLLVGKKVEDEYSGLVTYELVDEGDRDIEVRFPSILRHDILPLVQAIVQAITLNGQQSAGIVPDSIAASMLFSALGENEYDDIIAAMFPNQEFTFNAGFRGIKASQGEQSDTDKGLDNMGGTPPNPPTGNYLDPGLMTDLAMIASKRLRESTAGMKVRHGKDRSGIIVETRARKVVEEKEEQEKEVPVGR